MKTQNTATTVEIRDNALEPIPSLGWGWPDEDRLANFTEQADWVEENDWMKQSDRRIKDDPAYAALYFGS